MQDSTRLRLGRFAIRRSEKKGEKGYEAIWEGGAVWIRAISGVKKVSLTEVKCQKNELQH